MGRKRSRVTMDDKGNLKVQTEACDISDRKKLHFCPGMDKSLNPEANWHGKGLTVVNIMKLDTGKERFFGVAYKTGSKDKGIFINWCPFCGSDLKRWLDYEQEQAEKRRAKEQRAP